MKTEIQYSKTNHKNTRENENKKLTELISKHDPQNISSHNTQLG